MYGNEQKTRAISGGFAEPPRSEVYAQQPMPIREREPDVTRVAGELERNVMQLCDVIGVLEARLSTLMSPPLPSNSSSAVGLPTVCELGTYLCTQSDRIAGQAQRVSDILSRLEV